MNPQFTREGSKRTAKIQDPICSICLLIHTRKNITRGEFYHDIFRFQWSCHTGAIARFRNRSRVTIANRCRPLVSRIPKRVFTTTPRLPQLCVFLTLRPVIEASVGQGNLFRCRKRILLTGCSINRYAVLIRSLRLQAGHRSGKRSSGYLYSRSRQRIPSGVTLFFILNDRSLSTLYLST